jgi:tetratricopeptide (TPR) repeat protein
VLTVDPYLLLLLIACLFILGFGGLSLLRREGLSVQFALESVGLTVLLVGLSWLLRIQFNTLLFVLFFVLLYLVTMRSRYTVDLANLLVGRGLHNVAFLLYRLSLAWWPDDAARLIALTDRGAAELRTGQIETAIQTLQAVLDIKERPRLGLKYEAACRCNLGWAYEQQGETAKAVQQYNEVLELLPGSRYGKAAQAALKRVKEKQT